MMILFGTVGNRWIRFLDDNDDAGRQLDKLQNPSSTNSASFPP